MSNLLRKRLHISWLILWLCVGMLLGLAVSAVISLFLPTSFVIFACLLIVFSLLSKRSYMVVFIVLAGFLLGFARGVHKQQNFHQTQNFTGSNVIIQGKVSDDVVLTQKPQLRFRISNLAIDGEAVQGEIWVSSNEILEIKRSDTVTVKGRLDKGFGSFIGVIYNAQIVDVVRPAHADVARDIRDWFAGKVRDAIDEPGASLGIGFLVGQRSTLPQDLVNSLQILGLTHIVVASGYNLTILVRLARRLFEKISKYLATVSAFGLMMLFIFMIGSSPSMIRAGIITTLSLLAWYFGRSINPVILLAFTASLTAMINPFYIWGDIGWYLSFFAFAGVVILSPLSISYFFDAEKPNTFLQIVTETTSAQLMTLPIVALTFGQIALLAIPANTLILPFIPLTMLLTFLSGLSVVVLPFVAPFIAWPTQAILNGMIKISDYLANLPMAQKEIHLTLIGVASYYVIIVFVILWLKSQTKHNFTCDNVVE